MTLTRLAASAALVFSSTALAFVPAVPLSVLRLTLRTRAEGGDGGGGDDPFGSVTSLKKPDSVDEAPPPPPADTRSQAEQWASPTKKTYENYSNGPNDNNNGVRMSLALPFVAAPAVLDGTLAGDVGFDPLGLAGDDKGRLMYFRDAEVKHARLAMLAAAGWPISELLDKDFASLLGRVPLLASGDEAPSLLNGGLEKVNPFYWIICLAAAGIVELTGLEIQEAKAAAKEEWIPGDFNWDPLGLLPKDKEGADRMKLAEIKHGRLAMVAITAFAAQEFVSKQAVVAETPAFFQPFGGLFGAHW